ncbi:MAG: peroxide stress protein YaaA [Bacteroidota bacterium]
MKLVLSPAKSLDYDSKLPTKRATSPYFIDQAEQINTKLKKKSRKQLSNLMSISDSLADLNYERNQEFSLPFDKDNARPAIYAFSGDVYRGFDAYTLENSKLDTLQSTVRILSGLYGLLKPLDLIQPYRLEMGTNFSVGRKKNLYQFWNKHITEKLNHELQNDELFVNLASNEYFKAIDTKTLKVPVIDIKFQELKNGNYKTIAFYSKVARGLMARYIVENDIDSKESLKDFDLENYRFTEKLSSENELVFAR